MLFSNKLFNSIACLLSFTNLQLVIPGRTWILLYLGRTVYKRLWVCLALYMYYINIYARFQIKVKNNIKLLPSSSSVRDETSVKSSAINPIFEQFFQTL